MKSSPTLLLLLAPSCLAFSPQTASPTKALSGKADRSRHSVILAASSDDGDKNPFSFLQGIFPSPSGAVAVKAVPQIPDVVVDTDYTLAAAFAVVGVSIVALNHGVGGIIGGGFITLLASLFAVQATRLRFVFDKDSFELKEVESAGSSEDLQGSGENIVVGGANRWAYNSFVNWDFYPSADLPILVYFKETQTSEEGQIHFFPAIANVKQLKEQFELRGCASVSE